MLEYRKLAVRDRSLELASRILDLVETPPFERRYWIKQQMSDAVCSI